MGGDREGGAAEAGCGALVSTLLARVADAVLPPPRAAMHNGVVESPLAGGAGWLVEDGRRAWLLTPRAVAARRQWRTPSSTHARGHWRPALRQKPAFLTQTIHAPFPVAPQPRHASGARIALHARSGPRVTDSVLRSATRGAVRSSPHPESITHLESLSCCLYVLLSFLLCLFRGVFALSPGPPALLPFYRRSDQAMAITRTACSGGGSARVAGRVLGPLRLRRTSDSDPRDDDIPSDPPALLPFHRCSGWSWMSDQGGQRDVAVAHAGLARREPGCVVPELGAAVTPVGAAAAGGACRRLASRRGALDTLAVVVSGWRLAECASGELRAPTLCWLVRVGRRTPRVAGPVFAVGCQQCQGWWSVAPPSNPTVGGGALVGGSSREHLGGRATA